MVAGHPLFIRKREIRPGVSGNVGRRREGSGFLQSQESHNLASRRESSLLDSSTVSIRPRHIALSWRPPFSGAAFPSSALAAGIRQILIAEEKEGRHSVRLTQLKGQF